MKLTTLETREEDRRETGCCAECPRPACWQILAERAGIVTGVLMLCDRHIGELRSLLQWRNYGGLKGD